MTDECLERPQHLKLVSLTAFANASALSNWNVRCVIARNEKKYFLYRNKITLFILFPSPENRLIPSSRR